MPDLQKPELMRADDRLDASQFVTIESVVARERYGQEPELCAGPIPVHVDVRGFSGLVAEEVELVWTMASDARHWASGAGRKPGRKPVG